MGCLLPVMGARQGPPNFLWERLNLQKESQELLLQPDSISSLFEDWLLNTLAVTFPASDSLWVSPLVFHSRILISKNWCAPF